jgi:hypothetical protein
LPTTIRSHARSTRDIAGRFKIIMCSMLSTTPSSSGELLIQHGELAGRRYRFEAIVCENPTCPCDHVTLKCFTEMPEASLRAPIVVCLEMDLER